MLHVTADVEGWLKVDAAHCRVFDGEVDDSSDLVFVDSALYRGNQRHVQADGGETVEGKKLLGQDVGLSTNDAIGLGAPCSTNLR